MNAELVRLPKRTMADAGEDPGCHPAGHPRALAITFVEMRRRPTSLSRLIVTNALVARYVKSIQPLSFSEWEEGAARVSEYVSRDKRERHVQADAWVSVELPPDREGAAAAIGHALGAVKGLDNSRRMVAIRRALHAAGLNRAADKLGGLAWDAAKQSLRRRMAAEKAARTETQKARAE